eukprot:2066804-Amphidinium_carterae.2
MRVHATLPGRTSSQPLTPSSPPPPQSSLPSSPCTRCATTQGKIERCQSQPVADCLPNWLAQA